jgi:hypothetical protein
MFCRTIAVAACAALLAAAPAQAKDLPADGLSPAEVAKWLTDNGFQAEVTKNDKDESYIKTAAEGMTFEILFYDCKPERCLSMELLIGFDLEKPMTAEQLNAWNSSKRYARAYPDAKGAPWFSYDINLSPGGTYEAMEDNYAIWIGLLPDFRKHVGWD